MPHDYLEPEDLLTDESFLSWYFGSGREADGSWGGWAEGSPARRALLDRAVALLEMTRVKEKAMPEEKVEAAVEALLGRIDGLGETAEVLVPGAARVRVMRRRMRGAARVRVMRRRMWVAAAVLVVLTGGFMVARTLVNKQQRLATTFGEVNLRTLPDGSVVTMNANSTLRLSSNWQGGADREVWIDGEAFFHVQKTPQKSRFIVHTDRFDVIVTGTQFDVVNRSGKENVMLREGSVIVHPREGGDLAMVPGDFVRWNGRGLEKGGVKSDSLLAWKQHQLLFDKTPLKDVVGIIKDQYGVQIDLEDQAIADSTITGIMRNDNLEVFLQALETTSDYEVIRKDGKIAIKASVKP